MDIYSQAAALIIRQQQTIIGPIAVSQAKKVEGLEVVSESDVKISGDGRKILGSLVERFSKLFGKASIEVCKDAIKEINPPIKSDELPSILI